MEVVTREYKVYNFSELSEDAKEKAKQWYLDDDFRPQEFENIYTEDLHYLFNNSDLKMQFSLSYCQGDGLNIYGKLDLMDVFAAIRDTDHSGGQFKQYKDLFSEHEQKTIEAYMEACGREIELPYNRHYCYCVDDRVDFADEWIEIFQKEGEIMSQSNYEKYAVVKQQELLHKERNLQQAISCLRDRRKFASLQSIDSAIDFVADLYDLSIDEVKKALDGEEYWCV